MQYVDKFTNALSTFNLTSAVETLRIPHIVGGIAVGASAFYVRSNFLKFSPNHFTLVLTFAFSCPFTVQTK